jgi:hypothetical protein
MNIYNEVTVVPQNSTWLISRNAIMQTAATGCKCIDQVLCSYTTHMSHNIGRIR